ncbi:MAG: major facilitator superfamily 1 [Edaphobacter sp.]|nr:major facilitator superfamily 1 [Edaphobacter sp.]
MVFFGWFYIYLAQARGLNLKTSAVYSILPFIGMTISAMGGGVASDWLAQRFSLRTGRCILPFFAMATTSVLLIAGSRVEQASTAGILLALGAGVLYIAQSCFWAITADFAGEYAGLASGIMNMVRRSAAPSPHPLHHSSPDASDGIQHSSPPPE